MAKNNIPADKIVWIDCEMTGLDVENDGLTEVAVIITDFDLNPVHPGFEIIINPGEQALAHMNEYVRQMHTESGLLPKIAAGVTAAQAQTQLLAYLREHVSGKALPLVAGNTIGTDRRFISRYLPEFDRALHYRSIDVSTIKELARRWYPASFKNTPVKQTAHRALADIAESIRELAYFRETVFVPLPGPADTTARELQEAVVAGYAGMLRTAGVGSE